MTVAPALEGVRDRHRLVVPLAGAAFVVFWSSGFIGARWGTAHSSALDLLAWRHAVLAVLLTAVVLVRWPRLSRRDVAVHAAMGLAGQCVYLGLTFTGIDHGVPAGAAALIGALQPALIATVAGPLLGEWATRRQWAGLTVGVAGVALVVAGDLGGGGARWWVYLLPLGGVLGLVAGTVLERRTRPAIRLLDALTVQTLVAAVVFTGLAAGTGQLSVPADPQFYGAVIWLVVLSTGGGYGSYLLNLRLSGATRISSLMYLVPPTTMIWAFVMFGERIGAVAGAGMVVCAIAVALIRGTRRAGQWLPCLTWGNRGGWTRGSSARGVRSWPRRR
jgi:drug/metabolite transporter (DMT)-like permease